VLIIAAIPEVKQHQRYADAKGGDIVAAITLAQHFLTPDAITKVRRLIRNPNNTMLLPVLAVEQNGTNMIPFGMAKVLAHELKLTVETNIIQINRVGHTGATGWHRLTHPAIFNGHVKKEADYLIIDDFVGQGGTIANLRGHIVANGGSVTGAVTLTGKEYSAKLALTAETLQALRDKHGKELETFWRELTGYGLEYLTESEARYLYRADDAQQIRDRVLEAASR